MKNYNSYLLKRTFFLLTIFIIILSLIIFTFYQFIYESEDIKLKDLVVFFLLFFPIETSKDFIVELLKNTWITISIATVSLFISTLISLPLGIVLSRTLSGSVIYKNKKNIESYSRIFLRLNLIICRTIPELIIALLLIRIIGLGVNAGVLSIVIVFTGFMSKVFVEIIDSTNPIPAENLIKNGAGRVNAFIYGTLPQCSKDITSYLIFRWECAIRTSLVLGIVGAGGLGQQIEFAIKMMALHEVSSMLIALCFLVFLCDQFSSLVRKVFC